MNAEVSSKEEKRTSIALSTALLCPLSTPQVNHIGSSLLLSGWTNTHTQSPPSLCTHTHTHMQGWRGVGDRMRSTTFERCIRWCHTQHVDTQRITELYKETSASAFNSPWWWKWGCQGTFSQKHRKANFIPKLSPPSSPKLTAQTSFLFTYQWREV